MQVTTSAVAARHLVLRPDACRQLKTLLLAGLALTAAQSAQCAEPGVTDTEVLIGQTMPYSGPASGYAISGRVQEAYFQMINAKGGINGRKVKLISLDDGYSPP